MGLGLCVGIYDRLRSVNDRRLLDDHRMDYLMRWELCLRVHKSPRTSGPASREVYDHANDGDEQNDA